MLYKIKLATVSKQNGVQMLRKIQNDTMPEGKREN